MSTAARAIAGGVEPFSVRRVGGRDLFVGGVIAAGAFAVLQSVHEVVARQAPREWLILVALVLVSGSFTIKLPSLPVRISVTETFTFTCVMLFGPAPGTLALALDGLIISYRRKHKPERMLFNAAELALSIWLASHFFFYLAGVPPLFHHTGSLAGLIIPLLGLTVLYFVLNTGLTALAVAFETRTSALDLWRRHFLWVSVNYFAGASVSLLLVTSQLQVSLGAISVILPLLVISYLTFRSAMGRVEDATQHVAQVNRLYLSTIETLAIAIDAKDEVTHGHIRRVQTYAMELARALGVDDEASLKAIEAAGLLHDMGKVAVPEYILNKPGKLTPAEFAKMKLHVKYGVDILSAINFPYPVVPIVRCHHESWDGSGYPDGVSGTDIPIGARILSVVDCFDALTSDRPYRTRMSEQEAFAILRERRGTMYDPMVVDRFFEIHDAIKKKIEEPSASAALAGTRRSDVTHGEPALERHDRADLDERTEEMLSLGSLARSVSGRATWADAASLVWRHLRNMVPCSMCAFYAFERQTDELVLGYAAGPEAASFVGLRIGVGQKLSGWVAAHRRTIVNSEAALDFGEAAGGLVSPLIATLSTPLMDGEGLVGVLSLYSTTRDGFSADHRRMIEMVAPQIAQTLRAAVEENVNGGADAHRGATRISSMILQPEYVSARSKTWAT